MRESAFLKAFERLHCRLHGMAAQMLGDAEADDLLQEAFCRLWMRLADRTVQVEEKKVARVRIRGREASSLTEEEAGALLTATVRHLGIDQLRRQARHPHFTLDEERDASADDEPDEARLREQRFRLLETAIGERLTDVQREVVRRREYEGEDFAAIAAALGMQPAAVRMQLSRARKTIRQYFKEQGL